MKRDLERGRLIPAERVRASLEELKVAISQVIDHSHLEAKQKATIYANLQKLGERDFVSGADEPTE
jgi:tRNA(Ser,Leu) C12 N-acetylase TAN1